MQLFSSSHACSAEAGAIYRGKMFWCVLNSAYGTKSLMLVGEPSTALVPSQAKGESLLIEVLCRGTTIDSRRRSIALNCCGSTSSGPFSLLNVLQACPRPKVTVSNTLCQLRLRVAVSFKNHWAVSENLIAVSSKPGRIVICERVCRRVCLGSVIRGKILW